MFGTIPVNIVALLACGVAAMIIGMLWYGPLFGKQWMALMKIDPKKTMTPEMKQKMPLMYGAMFLASLILAYVLIHVLSFMGATTLMDAVIGAAWVWLGFIATVMIGQVLWEMKPVKLYLLNIAYYLVNMVVMAVIIVSLP